MCLTCSEHANITWPYDPLSHPTGKVQRLEGWLLPITDSGLKIVANRTPYGLDKFSKPMIRIMERVNQLHGFFQTLPSLESAIEVAKLANEYVLKYCACKTEACGEDPFDPEINHCILLNSSARTQYDMHAGKDGLYRRVDLDEVIELMTRKREQEKSLLMIGSRGLYQVKLPNQKQSRKIYRPSVASICCCNRNTCAIPRVPELLLSRTPSPVEAFVANQDNCIACGNCSEVCILDGGGIYQPISYKEDGTILHIDPVKCTGCGLCVENCPNDVIKFEPRKLIYDLQTMSWIRISE